MPVHRLLQYSAFGPDDIVSLTIAYEDALRSLRLVDRDSLVAEIVARKIIEVAQAGIRDPAKICAIVIEDFGIRPE